MSKHHKEGGRNYGKTTAQRILSGKKLLEKYLNEKVELSYLLETLGIKRRRFFELFNEYKKDSLRIKKFLLKPTTIATSRKCWC